MLELIAQIVLIGSFLGIGALLVKKIPVLVELPESSLNSNLSLRLRKRVNQIPLLKSFSISVLLQKVLSRARVLILKTEHKINAHLKKLREESKNEVDEKEERYWQELKKEIKRPRD